MDPDKLDKMTERLLRTSRTIKTSRRHSDKFDFATAVVFAIMGLVVFFFLFFMISEMFETTSETLHSKRFFLGFLLVFGQLLPSIGTVRVLYSASRKVYGRWISTRRTLFYIKSDNEYSAIDWSDVQAVEQSGPNIVFRGRHRKVVIPGGFFDSPSNRLLTLWFLNRIIEDYGRNRGGLEPLHRLRKKLVCSFLNRCAKRSVVTLFFAALCGLLPAAGAAVGLPLFYAKLDAGGDPQQLINALGFGVLPFLASPLLMLIPLSIRQRYVRKQALEVYANDVLPKLQTPLPRVSYDEYGKWQVGRRRASTRYQSDEETERFWATIPPPPRLISTPVKRRFLIPGETTFFTALVAGMFVIFVTIFLFQGTDDGIREARFWNWTPAGMGNIVRIEPVFKKREGRRAMVHTNDRFEFVFRHADGTETLHLDTRELGKGAYTVGQSVAVQSFRGNEQFMRLDSKTWHGDSFLGFVVLPAIFAFVIIVGTFTTVATLFFEGPKRIRYWETATAGWGKVIGATLKGTTIRLVKPEGGGTIFCPGVVYLVGRENLRRPLTVFFDPADPTQGTVIPPLPYGVRIDPPGGELVVDPKTRWAWPFVACLILLALTLLVCAWLKFFAV